MLDCGSTIGPTPYARAARRQSDRVPSDLLLLRNTSTRRRSGERRPLHQRTGHVGAVAERPSGVLRAPSAQGTSSRPGHPPAAARTSGNSPSLRSPRVAPPCRACEDQSRSRRVVGSRPTGGRHGAVQALRVAVVESACGKAPALVGSSRQYAVPLGRESARRGGGLCGSRARCADGPVPQPGRGHLTPLLRSGLGWVRPRDIGNRTTQAHG